jgi:hypothetical protein
MSRYALKKGVTYDTDNQSSETPVIVPFDMVKDVASRLSEIFGCFCLYAYDNAGRPMKIYNTDSEMERMALERLVETDFSHDDDFDFQDDMDVFMEDEGGDSPDDTDEDEEQDDDEEE